MSLCVLDASFTFPWLFEDEFTVEGDAALSSIRAGGAAVPAVWVFEIVNALGIAERRGRMTPLKTLAALALVRSLAVEFDAAPLLDGAESLHRLMRQYGLTAYDATYLELATRLRLPLATKDRELITAAPQAGVPLFAVSTV